MSMNTKSVGMQKNEPPQKNIAHRKAEYEPWHEGEKYQPFPALVNC